LGLPEAKGVLISGIEAGGPADNGELKAGDIVIAFDGTEIRDARALSRIVAETEVGKEVTIEILRDGERRSANIVLGRLEEMEDAESATNDDENEEPPIASAKVLGMTIVHLDEEMRTQFDLAPEVNGVLVSEVEANSMAANQ